MKKINIFAMLLSLACTAGFVACDDDETVKQQLAAPSVSESSITYESLAFSWEAVANTMQYGYKLYDDEDLVVEAGVTKGTSALFSGLRHATTYKLLVWAFPGLDTDYSASPAAELTATTADLVTLAAPANLTAQPGSKSATLNWDAVEDAESYEYTLSASDATPVKSGETTANSVRFSGLADGDYTFSVKAATSLGGYLPSSESTVSFTVAPAADNDYLWMATGTYTSESLGKSWNVEMTANNDGSYTMKSFYGADGYDLCFKVNSEGGLDITNGTPDPYGWGYDYMGVETGDATVYELLAYVAGGNEYTGFYGDGNGGEVWIGYYYGDNAWASDSFVWDGSTPGRQPVTIDSLVGSYDNHISCTTSLTEDWSTQTIDEVWPQGVITKVDDTTVSIDGIYWTECPVDGVVDLSAMTITITPQECGFYVMSNCYDQTAPIVATINSDGSITFPEVGLWYEGYSYLFADCVFIKTSGSKNASSLSVPVRGKSVKAPKRSARRRAIPEPRH